MSINTTIHPGNLYRPGELDTYMGVPMNTMTASQQKAIYSQQMALGNMGMLSGTAPMPPPPPQTTNPLNKVGADADFAVSIVTVPTGCIVKVAGKTGSKVVTMVCDDINKVGDLILAGIVQLKLEV